MVIKAVQLRPDLMRKDALWKAAYGRCARLRWDTNYSPKQKDRFLDELCSILQELELRGDQLELPFEPTDTPAA